MKSPFAITASPMIEAGRSARQFHRLDVGDLRITAQMSLFGPMIVGRIRDYIGGDLGWAYMSPDLRLLPVGELQRNAAPAPRHRPWVDVDRSFVLARRAGHDLRVSLPGLDEGQALRLAETFALRVGLAAEGKASSEAVWLDAAARWWAVHPELHDRYRGEHYLPGWVARVEALSRRY